MKGRTRLLLSYCCDIFKEKKISRKRHGVPVRRSCVRGLVTGEDDFSDQFVDDRSLKEKRYLDIMF